MEKLSYIEEAYISAFNDELEKISKLRVGDIEDNVGSYLPDNLEDQARDLIANETAKSFAIRHPWISGVPTLGIWPALAHAGAVDSVTSRLARKNPEVRRMIADKLKRDRDEYLEESRLQIESDKANQLSNAVASTIGPIMALRSNRD